MARHPGGGELGAGRQQPGPEEELAGGGEIPWLATFGGTLHSPVAWLLLAMIAGHVVMALWHHFVRRDGVLRRML